MNDFTYEKILKDITKFMVTVVILFGGNNFNGNIYDGNVHDKVVEEILDYFRKIFQRGEHTGAEIFVCGLIPRPKYPHLKTYFEKTSLGIFQLSKQYKFVTFIDCQSLFYDSRGRILTHYFKGDLVHLNTVSSKMLAQHVFNEICKRK